MSTAIVYYSACIRPWTELCAADFEEYTFHGRHTDLIFAKKEFQAFLELCDGVCVNVEPVPLGLPCRWPI